MIDCVDRKDQRSGRVGQQVLGGIRFAGVGGAPDRPWKLDKDNWQGRVGLAYSLNNKTVLRAGYGKYFLNPTGQGNNAGFAQSTNLIASTDGNRNPTYLLSNPFPNGIQTPPGSSLGAETFLGRGLTYSNPDFKVPYVHQFSAGVQRELPWHINLEMTYAGSRSYDLEAGFNAINEPSAAFQATCDVTKGGNRANCDQLIPNPYFNVRGFEGTTRFTNATLSRFELARPFPAFGGITQNQNNIGKLTYDSAQFVANKRMAKGVTINASYTFDALLIAADAFKRAKTTDRKALADAIRQTNIPAADRVTFGGPIKFNAKGQVEGDASMVIQNLKGKPTVVLPKEYSEGKLVFPMPKAG